MLAHADADAVTSSTLLLLGSIRGVADPLTNPYARVWSNSCAALDRTRTGSVTLFLHFFQQEKIGIP